MRVVLLPAVAGRETGQIMTNSGKRHTPEQVIIGDWKDEYNHHRRHSSLCYLTPSRVRSALHPSNRNRRLTHRPDRMKGAAHYNVTL